MANEILAYIMGTTSIIIIVLIWIGFLLYKRKRYENKKN